MGIETEAIIKKEIIELHRFFEDWAKARIPENEDSLSRLKQALADDFIIITPGAQAISKHGLVEMITKGYGNFADHSQKYKIWIEDIHYRRFSGKLFLATYKEWQNVNQEVKGRLSTALFSSDSGTPGRLKWHHVHETWIQDK